MDPLGLSVAVQRATRCLQLTQEMVSRCQVGRAINRKQCVLFDTRNRDFGSYSAPISRMLISVINHILVRGGRLQPASRPATHCVRGTKVE
jgi:hypothetical protein